MAVCTQPAEVHAGYQLRLCGSGLSSPAQPTEGEEAEEAAAPGPTPAAVMAAVRPALEQAWAAALDAATIVLAEQPVAEAATDAHCSSALQEQHAVLLDISQLALSRAAEAAVAAAAGPPAGSGAAAELAESLAALSAALAALQRLTSAQFVVLGWLSAELSAELAALLLGLLESTLLPLSAPEAAAAPAQARVPALAAAAAVVLRQLPVSPSLQQQVVAAARAVLRLAAGSHTDDASGAVATADALAAVGQQLDAATAGSQAGFVRCLHQALELGVEVVCSSRQQQQLAAAAAFLLNAAAAACKQQLQQPEPAAASIGDLPTTDDALAAAVQALVEQARHCASANGSAAAADSKGQQLEAAVTSVLALGGALQPLSTTSSSQDASAGSAWTVGPALPEAEAPTAASSADDWDDDPFGDDTPDQEEDAQQKVELQPSAGAEVPPAAGTEAGPPAAAVSVQAAAGAEAEAVAEAAAGSPAAAARAGLVAAEEEDEWEEDPFGEDSAGSAPVRHAEALADNAAAPTLPAEPAAAGGDTAQDASAAGQEEDDWGDDPFASTPADGLPAEPRPATQAAAEEGSALDASTPADAANPTAAATARLLVLALLRELLGSGSSAVVQQHALAALRAHLQAQQQQQAAEQQRSWALACTAAALPAAAARVHELMGGSAALSDADVQVGGAQDSAGQTARLWSHSILHRAVCCCMRALSARPLIHSPLRPSIAAHSPHRLCLGTAGGGRGVEGRPPGGQPGRGGRPQRTGRAAAPACADAGGGGGAPACSTHPAAG